MLRSQDGIEDVENPYVNLKEGYIKVKAKKDKTIDLSRLVQLLEKEVGFEPLTQVTLEMRGQLARRDGKLWFQTSGTGQAFIVEKVEGEGLPEKETLAAVATLADPHSSDRIVLRQWKAEAVSGESARRESSAQGVTAELTVSGMT